LLFKGSDLDRRQSLSPPLLSSFFLTGRPTDILDQEVNLRMEDPFKLRRSKKSRKLEGACVLMTS
jgi:hypothetical protein